MNTTRRSFLSCIGRLSLGAAVGGRFLSRKDARAADKPPTVPNIVFILADDLGWAELGCYGNEFNETPNLDKLARQGMRFTDAYAAAPVCSPTRVSVMTGQYPAHVGITDYLRHNDSKYLSPERYTLGKALSDAGYRTCLIGKWHLMGDYRKRKGDPKLHGFDEVICSEERYIGGGYYFPPFKHLPQVKPGSKDEFLTDRVYREAVNFIERNKSKPFFLYVSNYSVHTRLNAPEEIVDKYRRKPDSGRNRNNPKLAAMLERIDAGIGAIMTRLENLGIADNTVFVFMSDNGGETRVTSNAPLRGGKSQLYEGGVREPMLVRWPDTTAPGSVCHTPVSTIDFYPTFADIARAKPRPDQQFDGVSIVPLMKGASQLDREALFWHYPLDRPHFLGGNSSGSVRKGDFKLIEFFDTGEVELYNLKEDVGEKNDLTGKMSGKVAELRKLLAEWRKEVDAEMPAPRTGEQLHLTFSEADDATECVDQSPCGRNVVIHGTSSVPGRGGRARRFNGSGDYLDLPRAHAPAVGRIPVTVSAWIRPDKSDGVILAHGGNRHGYALHLVDGKLAMSATIDWKRTTVIAAKPLPDDWVHVAGKLERKGVIKLFVNGRRVARGKARGLLASTPGDSLQVGADTIQPVGDYEVSNFFGGLIGEVRLVLGRRSDADIAEETQTE